MAMVAQGSIGEDSLTKTSHPTCYLAILHLHGSGAVDPHESAVILLPRLRVACASLVVKDDHRSADSTDAGPLLPGLEQRERPVSFHDSEQPSIERQDTSVGAGPERR